MAANKVKSYVCICGGYMKNISKSEPISIVNLSQKSDEDAYESFI